MNIRLPKARNTDPDTSHEAAASISEDKIRKSQKAVLQLFKDDPSGFTDYEMVHVYNELMMMPTQYHLYPLQSESGLRTRRKELVEKGLVKDSGRKAKLPSGRKGIIWELA
jgi:hypothetical protein